MDTLRGRLDGALSDAYRIERELGGGGMSRVFLAEETALGRRVVIKVLPPETAAALDEDRFRREIRLAAALQHPAIVPLLTAGARDDLLWFAMPYVAGESLRHRLAQGPLAVDEAVRYWRDLLEALEHAHGQGVVHRDIKPENVLVSGRHAVVTDFGIAKALAASTAAVGAAGAGVTHGTALGVVLGTPAYMAPEQAAGEAVDARADVYAAGLVMYEMLAGRGPFAATTPQRLLRAHLVEPPTPLASVRPEVPPALAALVEHCLAKLPDDRPASATAVLHALDAMAGELVMGTPAARIAAAGTSTRRRRRWPLAVAGAVLLALVGGAATAWRAHAATGLYPWQKRAPWTDSARVSVAVIPVAHAPADSLLARQGEAALHLALRPDQRLLVTPSATLHGLLRDFGVSGAAASGDTAVMLVRDFAWRAYVRSSIARVDGGGYLVTAEARAAADDRVLASVERTAATAGEVRPAIDAAGRELRAALAGGFGRLERAAGTGRFIGGSQESLRLFVESFSYQDRRDFLGAAERLRQAVRIDSTFALGWQVLAFSLANAGVGTGEQLEAQGAAYRHRATVKSPAWQLVAEASYFSLLNDQARAVEGYRRAVELLPEAGFDNNLALRYEALRQPETAVRIFARVRDTTYRQPWVASTNYVRTLLDLGRVDEAAREVRLLDSIAGRGNASAGVARRYLGYARKDFAALARQGAEELPEARSPSARITVTAPARVAALAQGRLRLVDSLTDLRMTTMRETNAPGNYLINAAWRARARAEATGDTARAGRQLDEDRRAVPWTSLPPLDRPYAVMIRTLVSLGRVAEARALRAELERAIPAEWRPAFTDDLAATRGFIALADGDGKTALAAFREADVGPCASCAWPSFARAYDAMGNADSTIHWYERYVASTSARLGDTHAFELARAYQRLGELYERRGDVKRAVQRYGDFVELWKDADAELQPVVRDVRARIARLQARSG